MLRRMMNARVLPVNFVIAFLAIATAAAGYAFLAHL